MVVRYFSLPLFLVSGNAGLSLGCVLYRTDPIGRGQGDSTGPQRPPGASQGAPEPGSFGPPPSLTRGALPTAKRVPRVWIGGHQQAPRVAQIGAGLGELSEGELVVVADDDSAHREGFSVAVPFFFSGQPQPRVAQLPAQPFPAQHEDAARGRVAGASFPAQKALAEVERGAESGAEHLLAADAAEAKAGEATLQLGHGAAAVVGYKQGDLPVQVQALQQLRRARNRPLAGPQDPVAVEEQPLRLPQHLAQTSAAQPPAARHAGTALAAPPPSSSRRHSQSEARRSLDGLRKQYQSDA